MKVKQSICCVYWFSLTQKKDAFQEFHSLKRKTKYENKTQFINVESYGPEKLCNLFSIMTDSITKRIRIKVS